MANISITYEGPPAQRHVLKPTAMTPLSALLAEACSKMKPPLDPARASLTFNKKPITDLSCPFRLANIPNGSGLTLLYDKPPGVHGVGTWPPGGSPNSCQHSSGYQRGCSSAHCRRSTNPSPSRPSRTPAPAAATPAASSEPPTAAATAPATASAAATQQTAATAPQAPLPPQPQQQPQQPSAAQPPPSASGSDTAAEGAREAGADTAQHVGGAAAAAEAAAAPEAMEVDARGPGTVEAGAAAAAAPPAPQPASAEAASSASASTATGPNELGGSSAGAGPGGEVEDDEADLLGLGRPSALFTRQALEAALEAVAGRAGVGAGAGAGGGGGGGGVDDPDDFYEVTPEDLAAMMRSSATRRVQEEASGFRTRAAREAEERAKASSYSHVAIRAHLPGDVILQIVFAATETVGDLRAAVLSVLSPSLVPAAYLYTTPPRTLLKPDQDAHSLYHVGLVPAAHVHVGLDEKKAAAAGHSAGSSVLRPEAAARLRSRIGPGLAAFHGGKAAQGQEQRQGRGQGQGAAGQQAQQPDAPAAASEGRAAGGGGPGGGGGGKVPKWLKLGAK